MRLNSLAVVLAIFSAGVYGYATVFAPLGGTGGRVGSAWPTLNDQDRIIQAPAPAPVIVATPPYPRVAVQDSHGLIPLPERMQRQTAAAAQQFVVEAPGLKGIVPPPRPKPVTTVEGWTPLPPGTKPVIAKVVERPLIGAKVVVADSGSVREVGASTVTATVAGRIETQRIETQRIVTGSIGPPMPPAQRAVPAGVDLSLRSSLGGPLPAAGTVDRPASLAVTGTDAGTKIAALTPAPATAVRPSRITIAAQRAVAPIMLPGANPMRASRLGQLSRLVAAVDPSLLGDGAPIVRHKTRPGRIAVPPRGVRTEAEAKQKLRLASKRRLAAIRAKKAREKRANVNRRATVRRQAQARRSRAVQRRSARAFRNYREFQAYRNRAIAAQIRRQRYIQYGYY